MISTQELSPMKFYLNTSWTEFFNDKSLRSNIKIFKKDKINIPKIYTYIWTAGVLQKQ